MSENDSFLKKAAQAIKEANMFFYSDEATRAAAHIKCTSMGAEIYENFTSHLPKLRSNNRYDKKISSRSAGKRTMAKASNRFNQI